MCCLDYKGTHFFQRYNKSNVKSIISIRKITRLLVFLKSDIDETRHAK